MSSLGLLLLLLREGIAEDDVWGKVEERKSC
jgi:hypothetical protein